MIDILVSLQSVEPSYLIAFLVGSAVGLSELLSRYSWRTSVIFRSWPGLLYLGINGALAMLAYKAAVDWNFHAGLSGKPEGWRAAAAAACGMAILRSSFANLQFGSREFDAGFSVFIGIFKDKTERALDQQLAQDCWETVSPHIEGLTFLATKNYLCAV